MTEKRPDGHIRTKSSLALSILGRTKGDQQAHSSAIASSPSASPTSSQHDFGSRSQPSKLNAAEYSAQGDIFDGSASDYHGKDTASGNTKGFSERQGLSPTIGQSVRTFRLFEVLRSADHAAISEAVRKTCRAGLSVDSPEGTTILHLAVQCAEPSVVEQIISMQTGPDIKLDLNFQDREGNTPLHLGSMLGRPSIVQILLAQPTIDSSILNYQGRSPIDLARTPEIFQQLQFSRAIFTETQVQAVHSLVGRGDLEALAKLFEDSRTAAVLDVNGSELATDRSTIETGGTLLHEATRKKNIQLIQLLLLHGADPFRRDRKGKLPQDVTKDDKTRIILKRSPAAAAAQRGVQEKAILGSSVSDNALAAKESREMKGYLKKWTNYTSGYKLRWFVLEDGVLSYYKHQDDAGSACRGAMNMKIAKLSMDAQDKSRFEIEGKSSVKYHLKANHTVEAKRWFWALNNAIQWSKDVARDEEQRMQRDIDVVRQARQDTKPRGEDNNDAGKGGLRESKFSGKGLVPATTLGAPSDSNSRASSKNFTTANSGVLGDDQSSLHGSYEPSLRGDDMTRIASRANTATIVGDLDDDDEYGDDASSREIQPTSKDAFNITAHSANLQLGLLGQVSKALKDQSKQKPETTMADEAIVQAIDTYESAVKSLQSMIGDLLRIARDRDAYWQYRLDREVDMRRLWEESMTKVAKEQERLESRIGESEEKRKRTKRVLRDVLDGGADSESPRASETFPSYDDGKSEPADQEGPAFARRKSLGVRGARRKSTIAALTDLSDSDSDADEEFFDAVGAGEVEVSTTMPLSPGKELLTSAVEMSSPGNNRDKKASELATSFKGYEEPVRKRLKMEADDRPKISLWGILKSMIGKDMTKMTLPVSFNEPSSLLQRIAEDMEYTDLLDIAADRADSTERMVYVAAFAASEYASTIGRVAKPFNPLLGETYEYARPDKGYRFFIEQVSHHPPIGAAWAESAKWDYYGESAVKSKFYGKSFDINHLGTWFLKLHPASGGEELYSWKKPTSSVIGIIAGSPTVDLYGTVEIKNWKTGEVCVLEFKPRGWTASSAYQLNGKVIDASGKTRWSIGGRWNDKIYARLTPGFETSFEPAAGKGRAQEAGASQAFLVWEAHKRPSGIPFNLTPFGLTLNALPEKLLPLLPPTDTRLRPDQRAMEDGQYDFAATEKNRVEEKQRAKRREREAAGEEFVPRWFSKEKCETTGEEYWHPNGGYWTMREAVGNGARWENVEDIF
ncbi:hypothetical protein MMC18_007479 [Xylographa bjoerkii]|nr:hypothetical protein [Xylographa bjoerkii]